MKTKYKYFLLLVVTLAASIFIYNYVEANTLVDYMPDIISDQKNIEANLKNDVDYSIDNPKVIVNPYGISPLTALIVFKTNDLASVDVIIKGKDDNDIVNTFIPAKIHYIPIYGLYADYENTVIIRSSGEEKEIKIKTEALPENLKSENVSFDDDFLFTTSDDSYPVAYDNKGNVRWYLTKKLMFDFTRLSNGYILLGNDEIMRSPYYSSSLFEMDLLGKIYYEYYIPNGYHHDVFEMNNGNFLVLSNDFESGTIEDVIVEIDRGSGKIIKTINLYDLIPNDDGKNWIGLNSICYDEATNSIIVVGSNKNLIISIDYNSSELNWVIGDGEKSLNSSGDVTMPNAPKALTLTENGIAFINTVNDYDYLVRYEIDNNSRSFKEISKVDLGKTTRNATMEYENDSFIITRDNVIQKVNKDIEHSIEVSHNLYSSKKGKMYNGDIYMLNEGVRLGSIGITPTAKNHTIIFHQVDKSIYKKYDLVLKQNENRLIVTGKFKKTDDVQIVLDNVLTKETYNVDVTEGKLLDDGSYLTETYINKEGIYGKHYVFLRINGKVYKLEKYILS